MFINHTNHLSQYWSQEQLAAAHQYGGGYRFTIS